MIAERQNGRTVQSTLQGEVIQMGIDQNAMAHIMNVLTDLYSNPLLAIIREYSTNAFDAHIEAGVSRPIEVSTPSPLSPFYRVKDFGVGLSAEDIRKVYSQYGNSTKRATNDQVGMLGLGCKSALTYTDNFVVVSVKDGQRVEVSIERSEDGTGVMKMPTVAPTNLPNGTEVIIPIKSGDTRRAEQEAKDFFRFWQPGTVLVNGAEPERITGLDVKGDGSLLIIDGDTDYVVMGNVAYPVQEPLEINHDLPNSWRNKLSVAAFVGIGEVNFPPSRETLMGTAKTKATLKSLGGAVKSGIDAAIQREVTAAGSHREAVDVVVRWGEKMQRTMTGNYIYKGLPVPINHTPAATWKMNPTSKWANDEVVGLAQTKNSDYDLTRRISYTSYPAEYWNGTLFLYGFDLRSISPTQKRKMRQYVEDNGLKNIKDFGLMVAKPTSEQMLWLGAENVVAWEDVNSIKLPSDATATSSHGRLPGSYDFYNEDGANYGIAGDKIDQSKPIFYVHGNMTTASRYVPLFKKYYPNGFYVVALAENRINKFCRILPKAQTAKAGVRALWTAQAAKFTAEELLALQLLDDGYRAKFAKLDPARVDDPAIREAIRLSNIDVKGVADKRAEFQRIVSTDGLSKVAWTDPTESYPLFGAIYEASRSYYSSAHRNDLLTCDDMYLYLNTKFGKGRQGA